MSYRCVSRGCGTRRIRRYKAYGLPNPGNIRVVLTEEQKTDSFPAASMETAQSATENLYYNNINTTRTPKPVGYPTDTYTNPNDYVAKLSPSGGAGGGLGPSITLKVMAGDKFHLRVRSWWNNLFC
ncbi:MAG TPA: hypothetical protein VFN30_07095 [Chitinophagaceae bacterium]|nr:hypothetical protein [Chitinophagaceae bacterium]